jgi:N-acetylglucosaminyl-diphospho-decaprenol L-rhamnosyltransferase
MKRAFDNITVITVTYQSGAIAEALARTLERFANVIVIDNASGDGTAATLARLLPHARVLANPVNLGFGPANNQAVAMAGTPYVLLLNPDCDISVDALACLQASADLYPAAAIIAPQGWHAKDRPQPSYRQAFYETRPRQPYRIPDGTCSAKWLHGCCLLIRTAAFRSFGGFDERFFLFYEDDDLCLRALQAGYDCLLEPKAQVMHAGGGSSTPTWRNAFRKDFYFFRSRHLIIGKYIGLSAARRYRVKTAVAAPFAVCLYAVLLQSKQALKWLAWGCSAWKVA